MDFSICSKANMIAVGILFLFFLAGCLEFAAKEVSLDVDPTNTHSDEPAQPADKTPAEGPKDPPTSEDVKAG